MRKLLLAILFCFLTSNCFALSKEEIKPFLKKECIITMYSLSGEVVSFRAKIIKLKKIRTQYFVLLKQKALPSTDSLNYEEVGRYIEIDRINGLWYYIKNKNNLRVGTSYVDIIQQKHIQNLEKQVESLTKLVNILRDTCEILESSREYWYNAFMEEWRGK